MFKNVGNDYETSEGESSGDEDDDSLPPSPPQELSNCKLLTEVCCKTFCTISKLWCLSFADF